MNKALLILVVLLPLFSARDTYREWHRATALKSSGYTLVDLGFEIDTNSTSAYLLEIFPQPIAAVLFAESALISFQANIARGAWKSFLWGDESTVPTAIFPPGSSLKMISENGTSSVIWTKIAWMLSSVTGVAFESLCPEQGQFKWMVPHDIQIGKNLHARVASNPNDPCCTENLDRLLELLPCRDRAGLAAVLPTLTDEFANAEFLQISIYGEKGGKFLLQVSSVLRDYSSRIPSIPVRLSRFDHCPFASSSSGGSRDLVDDRIPVTARRSLIGTLNRPERHQGKFVITFSNHDTHENKTVIYREQIPFFLVPLWHTHKVSSSNILVKSIVPSDGKSTPGHITWELKLVPNETVMIEFDVYKKFIPNFHSTFGFEKGFDLGGSVYHIVETNQVHMTRGLIAIIPVGDGSALFNFLAVGCTAVALFFGFTFRFFYAKRSVVGGTDAAALAERQPPIFKIINFVISRIERVVNKYRSIRQKSD